MVSQDGNRGLKKQSAFFGTAPACAVACAFAVVIVCGMPAPLLAQSPGDDFARRQAEQAKKQQIDI